MARNSPGGQQVKTGVVAVDVVPPETLDEMKVQVKRSFRTLTMR